MPREVMITVINLKKCLGMEDDGQEGLFIITNFNKLDVAFHVDQVVGIHRVTWNEIIKPDSTINGEDGSVATGVIKMDGKLGVILEFEAIVSSIRPETGLRVNDIEQIGERSRRSDGLMFIYRPGGRFGKRAPQTVAGQGKEQRFPPFFCLRLRSLWSKVLLYKM